MKIRYPPLDKTARTNIWSNLLLNSNSFIEVEGSLTNELIQILGELTTNGRDIRNIVRLARGLTAGEGSRVISVRHIMTAVSIMRSEDSGERLEETKRVSNNVDVWLEKQAKQTSSA